MKSPDTHFYIHPLFVGTLELSPEESLHAVRVCRAQTGDTLNLCDGEGRFAQGLVIEANPKSCKVQVDFIQTSHISPSKLHLALACLKDDGNEEVVFHASQTHLNSIIFLRTKHSSESKKSDLEKLKRRCEAKSLVSLKQSLKPWITQIQGPVEIFDWLKNYRGNLILCDIDGENKLTPETIDFLEKSESPTTLFIGPEGGFSENEIQEIKNYSYGKIISLNLGTTRLRAKTAALIALGKLSSLINF